MAKSISKVSKKVKEKERNKIPVTFNEEQLKILDDFKGIMGNTKAEVIRNIVINWILNNKK